MKIRKILCPTDFSEFSRRALEHATGLARTHGAELAVLHVSPFMVVMAGDVPYFPSGLPLDAATRTRLLADLEVATGPARAAGLTPQLILVEGDPADEILKQAGKAAADLIVMGTHGRRGLDRLVLGSVARRVVQQAPCSVLTVLCPPEAASGSTSPSHGHVLCPVDLGSSEGTLAAAFSVARAARARLTLLYVLEGVPQLEAAVRMAGINWREFQARLEKSARQSLRDAATAAVGRGQDGAIWDEMVVSGKPYREILDVADAKGASLIVMGIHGRSVIERMFFGSTALHVVQQARCPVLTVRPSLERPKESSRHGRSLGQHGPSGRRTHAVVTS
jgi:nucleotide-binding universal stress UspA family protein